MKVSMAHQTDCTMWHGEREGGMWGWERRGQGGREEGGKAKARLAPTAGRHVDLSNASVRVYSCVTDTRR